jgi:DNA polymerase-3 subunit delta
VSFNKTISQQTIDELVEPVFEQTIFDLIESVSSGQLKRALDLYKGLRANKAEPLYILSMLGWQLHNLLVIKAAAGKNTSEIAKDFGISPFVINKSRRLSERLEMATLELAYEGLVETDLKLKTSAGEPDLLMEQLIISLSQLLSPAAIES